MDWKLFLVASGPVVLVLLILFIILLIIIFERWMFFKNYELGIQNFLKLISEEALEIDKILSRSTNYKIDISFLKLVGKLKPSPDTNQKDYQIYFDEIFEIFYNEEQLKMERFLSFLASLGNLSPFIGLLGTVFGIIRSFLHLGETNIAEVNKGIAEALIATAVGLIVAIPSSLFYNYFRSKVDKINFSLEKLKSFLKIKLIYNEKK